MKTDPKNVLKRPGCSLSRKLYLEYDRFPRIPPDKQDFNIIIAQSEIHK